jgi:8-oxo-dGTP pyrophosphatase MutT (NUDIX family)
MSWRLAITLCLSLCLSGYRTPLLYDRLGHMNDQALCLCSVRYEKGTTVSGQMAEIQAATASALSAVRAIGTSADAFRQFTQLSDLIKQLGKDVADSRAWLAASMLDSGQVQSLSELGRVFGVSKGRANQLVDAGRKRGNPVIDPGTSPEPPVVAVAVIIEPGIGMVLTEHRTDLAPEWTFAGGEIEKGESPVDAIQRRVPAEIGLPVETDFMIDSEASARTGRFLRYVACHLTDPYRWDEATAELDPDADQVEWMTPAELDEAMPDMHPAVRALIRRKLGS